MEILLYNPPWYLRFLLGLFGALLPKFIELYYEGSISSIENRLKKNKKMSRIQSYILEVVYVGIGGVIAMPIGTSVVNSFTTGMGWEALVMASKRGVKK